jgi:hypothetical protein
MNAETIAEIARKMVATIDTEHGEKFLVNTPTRIRWLEQAAKNKEVRENAILLDTVVTAKTILKVILQRRGG